MFSKEDDGISKKELIALAGQKTGNLFSTCGFCCSESVLLMLNQGFGGGLPPEAVTSMGAGFCEGMGGAGCTCGSLSGGIIGLGIFLGPYQKKGLRKKAFYKVTREMHDQFRDRFRATCCRVLSKKVKHDRKMHLENCKLLTIGGAEIATELLLEARPELIAKADMEFLRRLDSKITGKVRKFFGTM